MCVCEFQSVIVNVCIHMNVDLVQVLILTCVHVYMEMYNFARGSFPCSEGCILGILLFEHQLSGGRAGMDGSCANVWTCAFCFVASW